MRVDLSRLCGFTRYSKREQNAPLDRDKRLLRAQDNPLKAIEVAFPHCNEPNRCNQGDAFMANTHKSDDYSGSHDDTKQLHSMVTRRSWPTDERVLEFRHLVLHHLHPGWRITSFQLGFSAAGGAP